MTTIDNSFDAHWNGKRYRVDVTDITRSEWRALRTELDKTQQELLLGLAQVDLDVMAGVMWLVMRRDDETVKLDDIDISFSSILGMDEQEATANPPD